MYPKVQIAFTSSDPGSQARIQFYSANSEVNVSNASKVAEIGNTNTSKKGFQFSSSYNNPISSLDGSYTYFGNDGYPGYIANASAGNNVTISFIVTNTVPDYLYITFDLASGEYAEKYRISNNQNGNTVVISDNKAIISRAEISSLGITVGATLTLTIEKWSNVYKSAKVTNINSYASLYDIVGSSLIDFRCSENLMDSDLNVSPGICEQYADINVYDRDKFFHQQAMRGELYNDALVTLSTIDNGVETILGTYLISDWNIDSNSSIVSIKCRDKSYILNKINIARSNVADRTVHDLLNVMFAYAANMSWQYLDDDTRTRCQNITIPDSWWLASDLYTMLNKICAIGMLRIYWYIDRFLVGRCV